MFQWESACTAVLGHNVHKGSYAGMVQEGGTGTICFRECTGCVKKVGRNEEGLGQWSWILLGGTERHNKCFITAYNLCKNKNADSGTLYKQQFCHFITKEKNLTWPLILFRKHLVMQLKQWRVFGDRIVLFMDHNGHVVDGSLGKALAVRDGLDLHKAILHHTGSSPGCNILPRL